MPQFVDAVVAADASAPAFISLGLAREVDGHVENVIIVQTLGFTDFPVQFAAPVELGLQGIDTWSPPAGPAVLAGRTYFQFIARSADRQLLLSFEQTKPPPVQTVKDVIASMFGL